MKQSVSFQGRESRTLVAYSGNTTEDRPASRPPARTLASVCRSACYHDLLLKSFLAPLWQALQNFPKQNFSLAVTAYGRSASRPSLSMVAMVQEVALYLRSFGGSPRHDCLEMSNLCRWAELQLGLTSALSGVVLRL